MLERIEQVSEQDVVRQAESALQIIRDAIAKLKRMLVDKGAISPKNQVQWYKDITPVFYAEYIYYSTVYSLELSRPFMNELPAYYKMALGKIENALNEDLDFFRYLRSGRTDMDNKCFTRNDELLLFTSPYAEAMDKDLFTASSIKVAFYLAADRLKTYILSRVNPGFSESTDQSSNEKVNTSITTIALSELIMLLHVNGVFPGKSLNAVSKIVSAFLNKPAPYIHKVKEEIALRKTKSLIMDSWTKNLESFVNSYLG